jgi:hypothetical protein
MVQREQIRALADEFGTVALGPRQEMEFNIQTRLMTELIQLEAQKIAAEANIGLLEKVEKVDLSPEQAVSLRREYVNSNPMVEAVKRVVAMTRRHRGAADASTGRHSARQIQATLDAFRNGGCPAHELGWSMTAGWRAA